jgi:ribosomal protein L11 methyltransferase
MIGASGDWIEVRVLAPMEWQELVADELVRCAPVAGIAFGRPSLASSPAPAGADWVRAFFESEVDSPHLRQQISKAVASLAERAHAPELRGLEASFRLVPREDWASSWRKTWKPFRLGHWVVAPRDWTGRLRAGDRRLVLEPGGAFGTGRHATTRACLRAIQRRLVPGTRALDCGTGSGILAVVAALEGARSVLGFDNDPSALIYARELAELNGTEARCEWRAGGFEVLGGAERFEAVFANIYADVIARHAVDLAERMTPDGWFVVSGCSVDRREETLAAVAAAGLRVQERHTRGRWDAFSGVRR